MKALSYINENRGSLKGLSVLVIGEPNPELRNHTATADETLLKPVDPSYVADRARAYCS